MLSLTVRVAERDPLAAGENVTVTTHVADGLIVPGFGQVLAEVILKSPGLAPVNVMLEIFRATVVLVSVSVELFAALVLPIATEPKLNVAGNRVAVALVTVPVPVRLTVCNPALVLSLTVKVAERDPLAVGENVIVTRHVANGWMVPEVGQVLAEEILKSPGFAPLSAMLLMFKATVVLVSVSVEDCAALVEPTAIDPKPSVAGSRVAVAKEVPVPVPVRLTVCEPALVLSFTVKVAEREPVAVGENVMVTRQAARGAMVPEPGHVLAVESLKSPGFAPLSVMLLMANSIVVLVSVRVEL